MAEHPTPMELWHQADALHSHEGEEAVGRAYVQLMIEHGYVEHGKPEPLPCGWPMPNPSPEPSDG